MGFKIKYQFVDTRVYFSCFQVEDANDNAPLFSRLVYTTTINEEMNPGISVLKVEATDIDGPQTQSPLSYSLGTTGKNYFRIDSFTGIIYTSDARLDRESIPFVLFTVFVSDGKHTSSAGVKVTFRDINDNAPVFPNPPYRDFVPENVPIGTRIMIIQAIDRDDPEAGGNTVIEYSLADSSNGQFAINKDTGEIVSNSVFDHEGQFTNFTITVKATDKGAPSLSGTTQIAIYVFDVNDNRPKFTEKFFYGTVSEDAKQGKVVTRVTATDNDANYNALFEFRIVDGNDPYSFYIDPASGYVAVSGLLNYDIKRVYNMTVTVQDRGMPPLSAHHPAYVIITVTDANTHPPVFKQNSYIIDVKEDVAIGYQVIVVSITDRDNRDTTKGLTYTITDGNQKGLFAIKADQADFYQAVIYTVASLDREDVSQFTLKVSVTDDIQQIGTCTVFINILDVNDNGPIFQPSYYMATIKENVNAEQFVTTVTAIDPDGASNGTPFTFLLLNTTLNSRFQFKNSTATKSSAQLFSYGSFDRKTTPSFTLYVKATDSGSPPKSSFAYVIVDVLDQGNKHEPFNGNTTIIVNALEGQFVGGVIGKPYYKDDDFNGDVNSYTLTLQSPGTYFTINANSGDLSAPKDIPLGMYTLITSIKETNSRGGASLKTVTSNVKVVVRNVTRSAVNASITLRLSMLRVEYFVGDHYLKVSENFLSLLIRLLCIAWCYKLSLRRDHAFALF